MVFGSFNRSSRSFHSFSGSALLTRTSATSRRRRWRAEASSVEPRFENLEVRHLLNGLTEADYNAIRETYSALNLAETWWEDYNIIVIEADSLNEATLRGALDTARGTVENDMIVLRTADGYSSTLTLSCALLIDVNAAVSGSVTIVFYGDEDNIPLTIDAEGNSRVMVIDAVADVTLAGLTITGGSTDGGVGGGIHNYGDLTVAHSVLSGNGDGGIFQFGGGRLTVVDSVVWGSLGGGIITDSESGSSVTVTDSTIRDNAGGGILHSGVGRLTVSGSRVADNGGVGIISASAGGVGVTVTDSTIAGNSGDGIRHTGAGTLTVTDSWVADNGGVGVVIEGDGDVTVSGSTLAGNLGGGILQYGAGELTVMSSTIRDNAGGGILLFGDGPLTVSGSSTVLSGNLAGGILLYGSGDVTVANATVRDNAGGGILHSGDGSLTVTGSSALLWGNLAGGIIVHGDGSVTVTNSAVVKGNDGGGILLYGNGALTVALYAAVKDNLGGGIVIDPGSSGDVLVTSYTTVTGNVAGGIIHNGGGVVTVGTRANITDNDGGNLIGSGTFEMFSGLTEVDYDAIRTTYTALNLSKTWWEDYNVIVIDADNLTEAALRAAIEEARGTEGNDLIVLWTSEGIGSVLTLSAELLIDIDAAECGSVTIISFGDVSLTIDAEGNSRVMVVDEDAVVALAGLIITGGIADGGDGGAIHNYGVLTVAHSTLTENGDGGIFQFGGGTLKVANSTLSGSGVGMAVEGTGDVTVTGSTIAGNLGAGILHLGSGLVAVSGSSVIENNTGGGIRNEGNGTVTVTGSTIAKNNADDESYGLGIFNGENGTVTVASSTLSGHVGDDGGGFGIENYGRLTVTGTTIKENANGGIYTASEFAVTVSSSSVIKDNAGGGILHYGTGTLSVTSSTLSGNAGGGLYIHKYEEEPVEEPEEGEEAPPPVVIGAVTVTNSTIKDNEAGGILHHGGGALTVTGASTVISGNGAGGILFYGDGTVTVTSSATVKGNAGGGILHYGGGALTVTGASTVISGNEAGGILIYGDGAATLTGSATVKENTGGGILHFGSGLVTVSSSAVVRDNEGGGIITDAGSTGDVSVATFALISGNNGGGILHAGTGALTVANSRVIENEAGGIFILNEDSGDVTVTGSLIAENGGDGIVSDSNGLLTLTGVYIEDHVGNGIVNRGGGTVTMTESNVTGNEAAGIVNQGVGGVDLTDVVIVGNGVGIVNAGGGSVTVTDSAVAENKGDGIRNENGTVTVADSILTKNEGSGLYNTGTATVTNTAITENMAEYGGGIYSTGVLTVVNSVIAGNTADYGGGMFIAGGTTTVTNATLAKNTATVSGGGLLAYGSSVAGGTLALANSILVANTGSDIVKFAGEIPDHSNTFPLSVVGYNNLTTFTGWAGGSTDNLVYDPSKLLFVDAANGNYRILPGSQAVNAGNNARALAAGLDSSAKDKAGMSRIYDGTIDIGAYESNQVGRSIAIGQQETGGALDTVNEFTEYWTFTIGWRSTVTFDFLQSFTGVTVRLIGPNGYSLTLTSASERVTLSDAGMYYVSVSASRRVPSYAFRVWTQPSDKNALVSDESVATAKKLGTLKASVVSRSATLTWQASAAENVEGYWIEWYHKKVRVGVLWVPGGGTTSADITGLLPKAAYSFRVYTVTSDGKISAKHAGKTVKTKALPSAKKARAIPDANGSRVLISWQPPRETSIPDDMILVGYNIYDATGYCHGSAGPEDVMCNISGLFPSTRYRFRIVAVYKAKDGAEVVIESKSAAKASVKMKKPTLDAPKGIASRASAGDIGLTSLTLHWKVQPNATGFRVDYKVGKTTVRVNTGIGGNGTWVRDDKGNIIGVAVTGLSPGVRYKFSIRATKSSGSVVSKALTMSVRTTKFPGTKMPMISSKPTASSVTITWPQPTLPAHVPGAIGYELYYTTTPGLKPGQDGWTLIPASEDEGEGGNEGVTARYVGTLAAITGLGSGQTYYIYVRSIWSRDANVFSNSGVLQFKTL